MSIRGKVIALGQSANGNRKSDGQPWRKQEYVLETEGKFQKKVAFSLMNAKIDEANIQIGQTVEVELDASSREYNGKWYTELTAWRVNNLGVTAAQPTAAQQAVYQQTPPPGYEQPSCQQPQQPTSPFGQSNDSGMPF